MNKNWLKRNLDEIREEGTGGGWNPDNKSTLEKFGETNETLTWNGETVGSGGGASTIEEVEGLQEALNDKADLVQVNGLETALEGKADTLHSHTIEDVFNLQNALDDKADSTELHSHTNKGVLDELDDTNGTLTYLGSPIGGGSGASTFVELDDTPSSLGANGTYLTMGTNMYGAPVMQWGSVSIPSSIDDLNDTPEYDGVASDGDVLTVGVEHTASGPQYSLEWKAPASGGSTWEHGTFTPTLVRDNNNTPSGVEIVIAEGTYHRMGDMVVVNGRVNWRNGVSLNEQVRIAGLPFDVESDGSVTVGGFINIPMPTNDIVGDPATSLYGVLNSFSNQIWITTPTRTLIGASTTTSTRVGLSFSVTYRIQE